MDNERGGDSKNDDGSYETHTNDDMSRDDDILTELSTSEFEALNRKTVYDPTINEETMEISNQEGRNRDGKNSNNNAKENSKDE